MIEMPERPGAPVPQAQATARPPRPHLPRSPPARPGDCLAGHLGDPGESSSARRCPRRCAPSVRPRPSRRASSPGTGCAPPASWPTSRSPDPSSTACCCRRSCSTRSPIGRSASPCTRTWHWSAWRCPALHGLLLLGDHTYAFTPVAIAIPFASPYAPAAVAVGQLAFYVVAIVTGSFYVRRQIGQRAWRTIHYLTFLGFVGVTAHGIASGSDTAAPWAIWAYLVPVAAVVFFFVYRVVVSVGQRRDTTGTTSPPRPPATEPSDDDAVRTPAAGRTAPRCRTGTPSRRTAPGSATCRRSN